VSFLTWTFFHFNAQKCMCVFTEYTSGIRVWTHFRDSSVANLYCLWQYIRLKVTIGNQPSRNILKCFHNKWPQETNRAETFWNVKTRISRPQWSKVRPTILLVKGSFLPSGLHLLDSPFQHFGPEIRRCMVVKIDLAWMGIPVFNLALRGELWLPGGEVGSQGLNFVP
jgi:hypothetical protein